MQTTTPTLYYIAGAVVIIAIILVAVMASRRAASARLAQRFGPEYEKTIRERGDRTEAERELAAREKRVKQFHIEELPAGARSRYTEEWRTVQTRFVDEPKGAIDEADRLVNQVMRDRGYPAGEFEQQAADLSPDHPRVLQNYRTAHEIAVRSEQGEASTEDLRQAMVHYRAIFSDLLGTDEKRTT